MRLNGDGLTCTIEPGDIGADYVALGGAVTIAHLKAMGCTFVIRYVAEHTNIGKVITPAEIAALHAAGIAVVLNHEGNEHDGSTGAPGGVSRGTWAREFAHQLGYPSWLPLFVSCDTDTFAGNYGATVAYGRAFMVAASPQQPALYGDGDLAGALRDLRPVFWRSNAIGWGPVPANVTVHVQQHPRTPDLALDPNECLAEYAAWLPHTITPMEDDDMPTTTARLWQHPKYANVWLIGPSTVHLSPKLATSYLEDGLELIMEAHAQTLKTLLHQCGLTEADLVPR